jgi:hypothetical protein
MATKNARWAAGREGSAAVPSRRALVPLALEHGEGPNQKGLIDALHAGCLALVRWRSPWLPSRPARQPLSANAP